MPHHDSTDLEFVKLLTASQEMLRAFALSLVPNHPDVQDLVQEINIVLWEKRSSFELGTNFSAWAHKIARYEAMNARRKLQRAHWLVFNDDLIDLIADRSTQSDMHFESRRDALQHCMAKLKPADQELLHARYSSRTALERYALETQRSRVSLRVTLGRLRSTLRRCITHRMTLERSKL